MNPLASDRCLELILSSRRSLLTVVDRDAEVNSSPVDLHRRHRNYISQEPFSVARDCIPPGRFRPNTTTTSSSSP